MPGSLWQEPEHEPRDPSESVVSEELAARGHDLATLAWEFRDEADAAIRPLVPEWPLHRQPLVDRNILRLAWYEVVRGEVPPKVAINESVELAREFGGERSPAFVNGVLDRLFRERLGPAEQPELGSREQPSTP